MTSIQGDTLDCKVEVRKYVLVSQPSRWSQKSERVVVQSPMLQISKTVLDVPVKRFNGEEENSVCFIPKQDIEKDTSSIYEKAQVSKATSWVDAHGVALFDSSVHDKFAYCRGHRFWICIGSNMNGYDDIVPVINLKTYEKGDIRIDQVCWHPKFQGPNGELWTRGGGSRQLKQQGAKKFSYWSWVICQRLDGSTATTKTVEIPAKDVKMEDKRQLSTSESRSLFKKRMRCMIGGPVDEADQTDQSESRSCSPAEYILRDQAFILPTPPASPDQQLLQLQQLPKRVLTQVPQQLPPLPRPWRGIFELSRQKNGRYVLRNSLIHPQGLPRSQVQARRPLLFFTEALSEDIDSDMNDDASTGYGTRESSFLNTRDLSVHNTRESSPSRASVRDEEAFKHERPDLGADVYSALVLLDLYRKDREKLQAIEDDNESDLYDDDANIYLDAESPREAWEANKLASNSIFTALCNLKDPQCPYTKLSTKLHYHCPPEKCQLSEPFPLSNPWLFNQEQQLLASSHDPSHVHCVSRLGPFPDSAGECHLFNSIRSFPNHKCCYWNQADLDTIPERGKRAYESKKLEEAKRMHLRILDRREWISGWLGVGREVSIRDLEGRLDGGGREWMQELERGDWDGEVGRVIGSVGEYLGLEGVDRQLALEM